MTWLFEVYAIYPLWCFIDENFMHVDCDLFWRRDVYFL